QVFVNNKKYACATCIKGHRSSTCGHTDRPLFEIKRKGRPQTQCEHCRRLRKTRQVHVRCDCASLDDIPDGQRGA
ncbi:copper-fist-domain-containing protein, partial [Calocera viscosa TUFC12733]